MQSAECRILHLHVLHLSHLSSLLRILQLYKNDRLSVSSTENSAIESHPQTVSQNSSFSCTKMTDCQSGFNGFRAYYVRLTFVRPAEMTTSGAPFVIVLSSMVHEEIGARPGHVVLQA